MWAGRPRNWLCLLLLAGACGCEQLEPLRQGVGSTYNQELRDLANEIKRKDAEDIAATKDWKQQFHADAVSPADDGVITANLWHPASLANAVTLKAPVPLEATTGFEEED
jgi:hypothetical protein